MTKDEWKYNHDWISDEDILYRRIPKKPEIRTYDTGRGVWVPGPGAFRRQADEGLSTHLQSILCARGRDPEYLYDANNYGSIGFPVAAPRRCNVGVLRVDDAQELDADLRSAHTEIRPPYREKKSREWKTVVNEIMAASWWVQAPA